MKNSGAIYLKQEKRIYLNNENTEYFTVPNQNAIAKLYTDIRNLKKQIVASPNGSYDLSLKLQNKTREVNSLLNANRLLFKLVKLPISNDNVVPIKEEVS